MRGRKNKPLSRQISEGDTRKRGTRKLREQLAAEPKAFHGLPPCPRHLKGRARSAWAFWREELIAMKLDFRPDAMMLEGACVGYARAVQADIEISASGLTFVNLQNGQVKPHPAVAISNSSWAQVRAFCSEFGLSPVSRTRLSIEKPDNGEKDLAALLATPRAPRKERVQ